jgi:ABC-type nickel/cobalt efflux system permease component RcnA
MRLTLIAATLLVLTSTIASAQNPFLNPGGEPRAAEIEERATGADGDVYGAGVPGFIRSWSRSLQERIASLSRRVREGEWTAAILAFGVAVVFGMVHIAGPGHGKMFAVSYFSGREARPREGILYSVVVNLVDSVSAFAIVLLGYVVLRAVLPGFRSQGPRILEIVSYSIVVLFGILHLLSHLRGGSDHHHHHDHNHDQDGRSRPSWLLAVSVGLVPCPVSTILFVYGIANGVLPLMVLMVAGVSIGGFVVMSALSVAVITGRSRLLAALDDAKARLVAATLEYAASTLIIAIGVVLLLGAI